MDILYGRVIRVGDIWTSNGDGYLLMRSERTTFTVNIVGSADRENETKIILRTVKYVSQLVGRKIKVTGKLRGVSITAKVIEEI
ncbi:MAG: hypothetical protein WC315_00075 [Candidatus Omnitrophota bacterium]